MADKRARWATARTGTLSPWSLAKVWALHAVSKLRKLDLEHTEIAQLVKKAGGGHPTPTAIYKLRKQVEDDPDWHPGKGQETAKRPGPKPRFTPQKKRAGAECAMAMTRRGEGVTVQAAQGRAATSCTNPDTGELFDKKVVLEVLRTMCHDGDRADTWGHYVPYQKTAPEPRLLPLRHAWAKKLLGLHDDAGWYYRHCVWFDPCHTVVPKGPRAALNQRQAGPGHRKLWASKGSRGDNDKLRGSKHGGKRANSGDKRVWWFVVLARGVARLTVMDDDWEQTGDGMARFVAALPDLL